VQKKEKEALTQFEKALVLFNREFLRKRLIYIASSICIRKRNKKAIERVEAQIKASPQNPFFYNMLGRLYEVNKDVANAEDELYKKAIEINPNAAGIPYLSCQFLYPSEFNR